MNYLRELHSVRIVVESNSIIEKCSFSGLRDGSIRIEEADISSQITRCMFLDCCSTGAHGGGICIIGTNSFTKISTCVASFCYTIPHQNELAEGQFVYIRSEGESSNISVENLCIFHCAPFMLSTSNNCQRAPLYLSYGCGFVKEINSTKNKEELYCLYVFSKQTKTASLSFLTISENECKYNAFGFHDGSHSISHCIFVHNKASNLVGIEERYEASITFDCCTFIFDFQHTSKMENAESVIFNSCYLENIKIDGAQNNNPSSPIPEIQHTRINLLMREIFERTTKRIKRVNIKIVGVFVLAPLGINKSYKVTTAKV